MTTKQTTRNISGKSQIVNDEVPDKFGCVSQLRTALRLPELVEFDDPAVPPSAEALHAAWYLAMAIGECRIFSVDAGDLDGVMPPDLAAAACRRLVELLNRWNEDTDTLSDRWGEADLGVEADELCLQLLEARMQAWASYVSIYDAHAAAESRELEIPDGFDEDFNEVCRLTDIFDARLRFEVELLSSIADEQIIQRWREAIDTFCHGAMPWWLDGTLEETAEEFQAVADRHGLEMAELIVEGRE